MGTLYKKYHLLNELQELLGNDEIDCEVDDNTSSLITFETEKDGNDLLVRVIENINHYPAQITDGESLNNIFRIKIEAE